MTENSEVQWIDGRPWAETCMVMALCDQAEAMFGTTDSHEAMRLLNGWIGRLPDKELEAMLRRFDPKALTTTATEAFRKLEEEK